MLKFLISCKNVIESEFQISYLNISEWKNPVAGKDWRQEEKETMEDEMIGWHHQLDGHEFEQSLGDGEGQEGLVCCSPWGLKESDMTEQLNNNRSP